MKKRSLLLVLAMVIIFTGGFYSGILFSTIKNEQEHTEKAGNVKMHIAPFSEKNPIHKQIPKSETKQTKKLIGYIQDFRDPNLVDYSNLTHIIFSFAHPTVDGEILLNGEAALNNLRVIVSKAHQHNTKVMLAVGGWYHISGGESYMYFKEAIGDPASRNNLINELVNFTNRENLDGIDIDFEHPRSNNDALNLNIFIKDLNEKLHNMNKELSIAVNAKVHSVTGTEINNVVYDPSMFNYVDHVNIMAYDGQWDGGYNAANLSPYSYTENIVNYWTNLFENYNIPKEKLVLGIPLYAQPEKKDIKQVSYAAIIEGNQKNAGGDTVNMNETTYHYNGEKTVKKKTKLALDNGFGGMMLWELGQDAEGQHSLSGVIAEEMEESNIYVLK
ncbi:glycoside hydrolase family 18 protein [Metabacillus fastidiosus]|uniref:glycoside hydrolase family 18 protein n=1 Tax=Metabacillus fastidiosus TaxID=1458 RepID=UPI002DBD44D3|nr:glycoside hydrolase family 18 protein [Metabacillus fastidiosus]MEC2077786.1 glycoside hydrolase family 18 protein [Metabacillus fastidiosus]